MSLEEAVPTYFHELTHEKQRSILEDWFRQNYENPAARTPYETAEGGYQWIWGGPFDAGEELRSEFGGVASSDVIDSLADELSEESWEWTYSERPEDYDIDFLSNVSSNSDVHGAYSGSINDTRELCAVEAPGGLHELYFRMLFAQVIAALEAYLSDKFLSHVLGSHVVLRRYVETTPDFRNSKIPLSSAFAEVENIKAKVRKQLSNIIWHNLSKVEKMYGATLSVEFPQKLEDIYGAIQKRHHIVHRNGKDRDGNSVAITREDVYFIAAQVDELVAAIEKQLINDPALSE